MAGTRRKPIRGIRALTSLTVRSLSSLAECGEPDRCAPRSRRGWSPGAALLDSVRDSVVEAIRDGTITDDDRWDDQGVAHEIADDAPSVYTHLRWRQFVDLLAYEEDSDFGDWPDNLTEAAGIALYQICNRLVHALVGQWREARNG